MDQTSRHTTEEIEGEISDVAQPVFNIIPEDIEKPHIHDNVKEPSVKKHRGQEREILFETGKVSSQFWAGVSEGHDSVRIEHVFQIRPLEEFPQKDNNVQSDDEDVGSREVLRANGISDGNHNVRNIIFLFSEYKRNFNLLLLDRGG